MDIKLTWDILPAIAAVLSVLAWIVPKFKDWFAGLEAQKKQYFMLGIMAVVTVGGVLLSYFGFITIYQFQTVKEWVWYPIVDFAIAVLTNAGVYKATNDIFGKKSAVYNPPVG